MLLTDDEINELWNDSFIGSDPTAGNQRFKFAKALQAAILAKLASAELPPLPEPSEIYGARWGYTADDMQSHAANAYEQGAASQLSAEPIGHGLWAEFNGQLVLQWPIRPTKSAILDDVKTYSPSMGYEIRPLFTLKEPK